MGASLVIRDRVYCDRPTLTAWVKELADQDAYSDGHEYSGGWNMCHGSVHIQESVVYPDFQAASSYIEEHQQKWESLYAVPAWRQLELPPKVASEDTKLQELATQARELEKLLWQQDGAILKRVKEGKSRFKACGHCESRINVDHLQRVSCPVCNKNLARTPTDDKQRETWKTRATLVQERIQERRTKLLQKHFKVTDPTQKIWVVGGWCAS